MADPTPPDVLTCPCCSKEYKAKKNKPCGCLSCQCQCCTTCISDKGNCCECAKEV